MLNKLLDNVFAAPFRLVLLFVVIMLVHQAICRQRITAYNQAYILKRLAVYGSGTLVAIFILVQLNMYSIFSVLSIFIGLMMFVYLGLRDIVLFTKKAQKKQKATLLAFFSFMEKSDFNGKKWVKKNFKYFKIKSVNYSFLLLILVSTIALVSRVYFINNDLYTLSSLWVKSLEVVKKFNGNHWFANDIGVVGEHAFISLYSKVIGISEEMAIYTFGLLECFMLTAMLFYLITIITKSKYIAPLFATLLFAAFFSVMPININTLFQHSPTYLAFFFALPVMLFTIIPKELYKNKNKYFIVLIIMYMAISLISLYVSLVVMPMFLLFALIFSLKKNRPYAYRSVLAYFLGTMIIFITMYAFCWINKLDTYAFFTKNIIMLDAYTYFPQLVIPIEELIRWYTIITWITLIALVPKIKKNRLRWNASLVFLVYTLAFLYLKELNISWIDMDLYYQTLIILIVIVVGIFLSVLKAYLQLLFTFQEKNHKVKGWVGIALSFVLAVGSLKMISETEFKTIEGVKKEILNVYDQLGTYHLPYSYAVVNSDYGRLMSQNEHGFIGYDDFIKTYMNRDSLYQTIKIDEALIKKNPEHILPESVLIFLTNTTGLEQNEHLRTSPLHYKKVTAVLDSLILRGRLMRTYYSSKNLKVVEIINKENGSNLDEMIMSYEDN